MIVDVPKSESHDGDYPSVSAIYFQQIGGVSEFLEHRGFYPADEWLRRFDIDTWPRSKPDAVMVLGRGVHGGEMTPAQFANIQLACDISLGLEVPRVVVSGGWTENRDKPGTITEAGKMIEYASNFREIPPEAITADSTAMDTQASLDFFGHIIEKEQIGKAVVVADYTHAPRVKYLIERMGLGDKMEVVASLWQGNEREKVADYLKWELASFASTLLPRETVQRVRGHA